MASKRGKIDRYLENVSKKALDGLELSVGVNQKEGSQQHGDSDYTVAGIGAVHEFGWGNAPQRSFIRATLAAHDNYEKEVGKAAANPDPREGFNRLGFKIVADIRGRIRKGIAPPLAPETAARKGSSKQLIDTGRLIQSISSVVK